MTRAHGATRSVVMLLSTLAAGCGSDGAQAVDLGAPLAASDAAMGGGEGDALFDRGCVPGIPLCDALRAFYDGHGGAAAFSAPYRQVLDTSVLAWLDLERGDAAGARRRLDVLWRDLPRGSAAWDRLQRERGGQVDTPPGQMVVHMLTRIAEVRLARTPGTPSAPLRITVPIAACARGVVPRNQAELDGMTGQERTARVDPQLLADDYAVLRQSLRVFSAYVEALLAERATVEVVFAPLPEGRCFDLRLFSAGGRPFSQPTGAAMTEMIAAVPGEVRARTDWWLLVYPTLIPDDPNDFDSNEWVTGGSTSAPGGAVLDFADDHWFLRQPPHFVSKAHTPFPVTPYFEIERFFYLPRWLNHETHHHLFGADFPELGLEKPPGSHSWFDRSTWPKDFVGRSEPDYFDQADFLRFQGTTPPIWSRVRWGADWSRVTDADLLGRYEACRQPGWSDTDYKWNKGDLTSSGGRLVWTNDAGVSWHLASWRDDATLAPGQVRQVDGPYAPAVWTFAQARDDRTGAASGVIRGYEGRARCPQSGCVCP